jgi:hypothetical protein
MGKTLDELINFIVILYGLYFLIIFPRKGKVKNKIIFYLICVGFLTIAIIRFIKILL